MSFPLWDLAADLAVARGGGPVKTDPMELVEGRILRRRIAALVWIPGAVAMLALGSWTGSLLVGLVGFAVLIAGLWLFAERWDRVVARLRRRKEPAA
jgi:O-antigen ligase